MRSRFRALIRQPEERLDLAEAALCIAWEDQGIGASEAALRELDALAASVRPRLAHLSSPDEQIATLNMFLFDEAGFRGNTTDYGDPANSFLDCVLHTRTGLPITLSVIYIELGRRLGLPISGVALPGHFIVRYTAPDREIYIDPFNQGRVWSRKECEMQVAAAYGQVAQPLLDRILAPPTKRAILERMLHNLKQTYIERSNFERALAAIERILLLDPNNPQEVRDRGLVRARLGHFHLALDDLDQYATAVPDAPDLLGLRLQARAIAQHIVPKN